MPPNRRKVRATFTFTGDERTVSVTDSFTLQLSGDRRRWKAQIKKSIQEQADAAVEVITGRLLDDGS
jgi:hypothetical protein